MIKAKDVKLLYARTKWFCECWCWKCFDLYRDYQAWFWPEIHHIYWKSQYRKSDRNELRNLSLLNAECHKNIHNGKSRELDKKLKSEADKRKPPELRSKTKLKTKPIFWCNLNKYDKKIAQNIRLAWVEYFKKWHDWLTPSQYNYRKQKYFIDKMRKWRK